MELVRIPSLERCCLLKSKRVFLDRSLFSGKLSLFSFQAPSTCNETLNICCASHVICYMTGSGELRIVQNRQRWYPPRAGHLEHVSKLRNIQIRINKVAFPYIDLLPNEIPLMQQSFHTPATPPHYGIPGANRGFSPDLGSLVVRECIFINGFVIQYKVSAVFGGDFIRGSRYRA